MSAKGNDEKSFSVLLDTEFERLTPEERLDYLKRAIVAIQRLQSQIERTLKEHPITGK
jgi:hypothetical protein